MFATMFGWLLLEHFQHIQVIMCLQNKDDNILTTN